MKNGKTYIIGISAFYHDSAAALIRDGEIIGLEDIAPLIGTQLPNPGGVPIFIGNPVNRNEIQDDKYITYVGININGKLIFPPILIALIVCFSLKCLLNHKCVFYLP